MSKSTMPVLEDGALRLRPPRAQDVEARLALGNTPEIEHMLGVHPDDVQPQTFDGAQAWVETHMAIRNLWMVDLDDRLIGNAFFHSFDKHDKRATLALGILDPNLLGQGLCTRILHMMLGWPFENNKLHRVSLWVLAYNLRAIAAYKKVGFVQEGIGREAALVGTDRHDDVLMGLLASEYRGIAA
jgi:RimJ/RimL family protein N-acetyltransferase